MFCGLLFDRLVPPSPAAASRRAVSTIFSGQGSALGHARSWPRRSRPPCQMPAPRRSWLRCARLRPTQRTPNAPARAQAARDAGCSAWLRKFPRALDSENSPRHLCRAELSPSERAACTAERKELYEQQHPETKANVAGAHASNKAQGKASASLATAFTAVTAFKTGQSRRAVQWDAERGSKLAPDVMAAVTGSQWDKGVVLDILKKLNHDEQRQALQRVQAGVSPSFQEAYQFIKGEPEDSPHPKRTRPPADPVSDTEARDQWLASGMSWWTRGSPEWREAFLMQTLGRKTA